VYVCTWAHTHIHTHTRTYTHATGPAHERGEDPAMSVLPLAMPALVQKINQARRQANGCKFDVDRLVSFLLHVADLPSQSLWWSAAPDSYKT